MASDGVSADAQGRAIANIASVKNNAQSLGRILNLSRGASGLRPLTEAVSRPSLTRNTLFTRCLMLRAVERPRIDAASPIIVSFAQ